jgi:hypothetical protein
VSFGDKWMELENIILSKVSQVQNTNSHILWLFVFSFICGI